MKNKDQNIATIAVHAGLNDTTGITDVTSPIHLSTTFQRNNDGSHSDFTYTRINNPNREAVEKKIAAIEGSATAIAFSSGLAAINSLFENILEPGSHVIIPDDCYHGTRNLLAVFLNAGKWNLRKQI